MSTYDAARMLKPAFFRIARLKRGRGKRPVQVIGFDSEQDTSTGAPMLFQFSRAGDADMVECVIIPEPTKDKPYPAVSALMRYIDQNCRSKQQDYLIVGFNLQYEWSQLFGDLPENPDTGRSIGAEDEFVLNVEHDTGNGIEPYTITVANNARYFATILRDKSHRRIKFIDARAFYVGSLDSVAAMLDLPRKLAMDTKKFTRADLTNDHFMEYARQDAYITRKVGEAIVSMHEDFDAPQTITAPHFASVVFRRHFLTGEIALAPPDLEQAGLYAYHGGKNGYYLPGPKHLTNVYAYDITSAYPEAMRALPDPELAEWRYIDGYRPGLHALWRVTGSYRSCQYRGLMQHGNAFHATGDIDGWTTGYELDAAVERGEIEIATCEGWSMEGPEGGALARYVDRFFAMKKTTTGAARVAAKLFLNSLYGKFFQKVPLGTVGWYDLSDDLGVENVTYRETDPTQDYDYQAGGLYHPPIAALITGFVRAKIHRLEHKYRSVMTSTDGFFALDAPDPADIGNDLGMLTVERGDLSIWRERLYDFRPADGGKPKYALHGFRGTIDALRKIPLTVGSYSYTAQQVITTKLAEKSYRGERYRPGVFAQLTFTLEVHPNAPP